MRKVRQNPDHSHWYVQRFRAMAARGEDLAGEARLVDALAPRHARVLDAGCGPGRVGAALIACGHSVVGVDADPVLIEAARQDHPDGDWRVGDLAELDGSALGGGVPFDAIVCAGNVVAFLAPSTREEVLRRLAGVLGPEGRAVFGFGAGRGYPFDDFLADARSAGLVPDLLLSTWDLRPFTPQSDFLVAILRHG